MIAETQFLGEALEMVPIHQTRAQDRQPAFGQFWKTPVKLGRHRELEHGIAEEFEDAGYPEYVAASRGQRKRASAPGAAAFIGEGMAEALLKIFEARTHSVTFLNLISVAPQSTL